MSDEQIVRESFWTKARQTLGHIPFSEDAVAAFHCATDSTTPLPVRATLFGALAYFILPFDFLPDMLPVLGFTDDAAVLATAIRMVSSHITSEHREAARTALKRGLPDTEG